jgi:protein TonB
MKTKLHSPANVDKSLGDSLTANELLKANKLTKRRFEMLSEVKKNRSETDRKQKTMFFFLGLSISLLMVTIAINWKTYSDTGIVDLGSVKDDFEDIMEVPVSEQPPPPPPKQEIIAPKIVEVDNNEVIEEVEVNLDVEMTEDTKVEDVVIDFANEAPAEEKVEEVFTIVEDFPAPVGGMEAFYTYIAENIKYPPQARRLGVSGMVFVRFVVEKDGSITDAQVIKGIGAGCDEEAVRVLNSAPAWKPGKQRGRPVRVYMTVPIRFILQNEN